MTTTTIVDLLDALREHLVVFEVPQPCSVGLAVYEAEIIAQVSGGGLETPVVAACLLVWADTITGPTAQAGRVPDRDRVHLSVTGRLPGSRTPIRVYTSIPHTPTGLGGGLDPDERAPVPLAALRYLADQTEVSAP